MSSRASGAKPEFEFLCLIARPRPALDKALDLLKSGLDQDELMRLARQHKVRSQLLRAFGALSWHHVAPDIRAQLDSFRHAHLLRALSFTEELCRIADRFARAGIAFATFKGVALASALYGDAAAREYNDIDIIVPDRSAAEAESVLADLGYSSAQGDRRFRQVFLAHQRQYALARGDTGFAVDLHWAFSGAYLPFPLTPDDVWREKREVSMGGRGVPTLGGANLALLLAGHGTKEQWRCLEWVGDMAMLIEREPGLDWRRIHERAAARGCGESVLLACLLANGLLDVPVPKDLTEFVQHNSSAHQRASALIARLRRGAPDPEMAPNFADLDLCDRQRDRIRAVLGLTFTPTAGDYQAMPLPPALWGLYRLTRPFRLGAKALRLI